MFFNSSKSKTKKRKRCAFMEELGVEPVHDL